MVEVKAKTINGSRKNFIWYVNNNSYTNEVFSGNDGEDFNVLSWTHPGVQMALSEDLGSLCSLSDYRYQLEEVIPEARAKFRTVLPEISGIYEPGGSVGIEETKGVDGRLKAVKLDMTSEQVKAFINKMSGIMFVTGAPGSGKTTVALQRVSFLIHQDEARADGSQLVDYAPEKTKVFLANQNLITYTQSLLEQELGIPFAVVDLVPDFITRYLSDIWIFKHNARPHTKQAESRIGQRAREAFFSLCTAQDLRDCWRSYENQISKRLSGAAKTEWLTFVAGLGHEFRAMAEKLAGALANPEALTESFDPIVSPLRMDVVFHKCESVYNDLRDLLKESKHRDEFDSAFLRWLFYAYDPLDCLQRYFSQHTHEGGLRIRDGTGAKADEKETVEGILEDWSGRFYRKEEESWLAWLLRFALPDEE